MPKVISRSTISSSNNDATPSQSLYVYFCICGEFSLVIDRPLSSLPQRPLDGSTVLRCLDSPPSAQEVIKGRRTFKLSARQGKQMLVQREDGTKEKRWTFECSRCALPVGYEVTPPPIKSGAFTYILKGSLTEAQGKAPVDALLDDS